MDASALMSPDFDKDFILYTFSTYFPYVVVLTQKHAEDTEIPISFMSSRIHVQRGRIELYTD